jgi:serine/threonine protein kinase
MLQESQDGSSSGLTGAVLSDLVTVKLIGRGAFGVVRLCQSARSGELFAVKQVRLTAGGDRTPGECKELTTRPVYLDQARVEAEALSSAARHREDWVVGLHLAFQDASSFYMVMDYVPGGDLVTHLQILDTFNEVEARFYTAELVEAVDYIHTTLGYIHRDIKPDNVVLDACGHVRIVDFGGCRTIGHCEGWREASGCIWGAPPYVAPEVHRRERYGKESDFWSIGVILYEMVFGGPPFVDDERVPTTTADRVVHWKDHFVIPFYPGVGADEVDLVRGLICDAPDRLTAAGVRGHRFFAGLDFARLREMDPPIRPAEKVRQVSGFDRYDTDTEMVFSSLATWSSFGGPQVLPSAPELPFVAESPAAELAAPSPKGRARWTLLSAISGICSRP